MRQRELRTERLILSIPTPRDVSAITEACDDAEIARWTPLPSPYMRHDAEHFVDEAARRAQAGVGFDWAIRLDGGLVGMISVTRRARGTAEIGFWTAAWARGAGVLAEAGAAVLDHGFEPRGMSLDRIEWHAAVGNVASASAARALGFRYEGVRRSAFWTPRGRVDAWSGARLFSDDPRPVRWTVLEREDRDRSTVRSRSHRRETSTDLREKVGHWA